MEITSIIFESFHSTARAQTTHNAKAPVINESIFVLIERLNKHLFYLSVLSSIPLFFSYFIYLFASFRVCLSPNVQN